MSKQLVERKKAPKRRMNRPKQPPKVVVTGNGAYKTRSRKSSDSYGARLGSVLGEGAHKLFKHITGFGDYQIETNSLMGGIYDPPELHNKKSECVVIRHREYMADINASSAFTVQSFSINPGMNETFPWLSSVAANFEEYRITGMIFEYKTLSADYTSASSAALGYIAMATQYNVYNPVFPNKKVLENYEFSNSAKPSESFIHPIECKKSLSPVSELFVRTGEITQGDLRLYDLGTFQIATGGNSGTGILGELWCTFEVELYKPKLTGSIGYDLLTSHYQFATSTISAAYPFGTSQNMKVGSSIGLTLSSASRTITFPATITDGNYLVVWEITGSVAAAIVNPVISSTNLTFLGNWFNNSSSNASVANGTTTTVMFNMFLCQITGPSAVITFGGGGTFPSGTTAGDLYVTQVNAGITI